jgi:hypothetical protein
MASEPVPSLHLEPHHTLGLNLVGTVAFPSPFPADGRIFVVRHPAPKGAKGADAEPTYHAKIVQKLSDSHSITRFVAIDHVRLIRFRPPVAPPTAKPASPSKAAAEPLELSNEDLRREVKAVKWDEHIKDPNHTYQVELRPGRTGVVFVPEQAPVLLRHEATVPAATSLESPLGAHCPHGMAFACPHCA